LSLNQKIALKLIAGTSGKYIFAAENLDRFGLRTSSQLTAAVKHIEKMGIVDKKKKWKIHDPFFDPNRHRPHHSFAETECLRLYIHALDYLPIPSLVWPTRQIILFCFSFVCFTMHAMAGSTGSWKISSNNSFMGSVWSPQGIRLTAFLKKDICSWDVPGLPAGDSAFQVGFYCLNKNRRIPNYFIRFF
jgi:hypothetical protein